MIAAKDRRSDIPSRKELEIFSDRAGALLATRRPASRVPNAERMAEHRRAREEFESVAGRFGR